jgi:hypothetical protein
MPRPSNHKEYFNLCHAQAHNVIEQAFRVVKHHFCLMCIAPEYSLAVQAMVPPALCALHNFIHIHDLDDALMFIPDLDRPAHRQERDFGHTVTREEQVQATQGREELSLALYAKYQWYIQQN